jgi:flagellar protein FliS
MNAPANAEAIRARFLLDRVLTATPAQRVVMLYDRLVLDLTVAGDASDDIEAAPHLSHAMLIVAELQSSLELTAGGPAENLDRIYSYVLRELIDARSGKREVIPGLLRIVGSLRESWAQAVDSLSAASAAGRSPFAAVAATSASSWVS